MSPQFGDVPAPPLGAVVETAGFSSIRGHSVPGTVLMQPSAGRASAS